MLLDAIGDSHLQRVVALFLGGADPNIALEVK